jgi:3-oxoacyl-[acyl-carrier-protein] synthase-1
MQPVAIIASGMVTPVGLNADATCAAIRCGVDNFSETRFHDKGGEWIIGGQVPLEQRWRGLPKLVHMIVPAVRECLVRAGRVRPESIPLLLCVAEEGRAGRLEGLDDRLFDELQTELGVRFHASSAVFARGRVAGALALMQARQLIHDQRVPLCIIAGVDSLLLAPTVATYEDKDRLLTSRNSNGFIPGEAAGAVLVAAQGGESGPQLICRGIGAGEEKATIESEEPLRGDGMVQALKVALVEAGCTLGELDFRITDANGEQYWFREATLALDRVLRNRKELFDIWHPADCIGEVGAAVGPCVMGIALQAVRKQYAFGRGPLCHFSADDTTRVALVLSASGRSYS